MDEEVVGWRGEERWERETAVTKARVKYNTNLPEAI